MPALRTRRGWWPGRPRGGPAPGVVAGTRGTEPAPRLLLVTGPCLVGLPSQLPDGSEIPLPPILLGRLGSDPQKKTVCIYGHLDVQPAALEDGWDSEPFTLVERDGKLYGRGSTDDKGPVAGWINALEAYQKTGQEIPVNVRFCLEGMEESGSEGLDELIFARKDTFFKDVDYVCISDNYWLGKKKPCITYGLRGICYFFIEVEC
ncbi:carnosine dipeptidase 2, partial [Homo sapiens]